MGHFIFCHVNGLVRASPANRGVEREKDMAARYQPGELFRRFQLTAIQQNNSESQDINAVNIPESQDEEWRKIDEKSRGNTSTVKTKRSQKRKASLLARRMQRSQISFLGLLSQSKRV